MPVLPLKAQFADHLIVGGLESLLRSERDKGSSFATIAKAIAALTDGKVRVSDVTVRAWAQELGLDTTRPRICPTCGKGVALPHEDWCDQAETEGGDRPAAVGE